jgi:hypothetical protein
MTLTTSKAIQDYKLRRGIKASNPKRGFDWRQWGLSTGPNPNAHNHTQLTTSIEKNKKTKKQRKKHFRFYNAKKFRQRKLDGTVSYLDKDEYYGHNASIKRANTSRCMGTNINNFIIEADRSEKNKDLFRTSKEYKADVVAILETGLDWRIQQPENGMYQRTRAANRPCKATCANNTTAPPAALRQHGGVTLISFEEHLPRIVDASSDTEDLGRWVTQAVEGKGSHSTRYVAAYMPCKSRGDNTVYTQHQEHFRRQGSDREPRQAFLEDFHSALTSWTNNGEQVVICMDANEDVREGEVASMFRSVGFEEQITSTHGTNEPPPATHDSNTKSIPIDGIWTNFGHGTFRCGYLGFGEGLPGDHRTAWIDIPLSDVFGYTPPPDAPSPPPRSYYPRPPYPQEVQQRGYKTPKSRWHPSQSETDAPNG